MTSPVVLLLPGWQNSGPAHWQSRWEQCYGDLRVEQHDWMYPLRGDWIARLEEVVLDQRAPCLLVAAQPGVHLDCSLGGSVAQHPPGAGCVAGGTGRPRA